MFVVVIGTIVTFIESIAHPGIFDWSITIWLFLTVLFANFAEAVAEGRGKAQADTLRRMRSETEARRLRDDGTEERVPAASLRKGDCVVCEANDIIPSDGDIIEGIASVDESAITGESAPVIRESGGDRSAVTGGTKVLSDRIVVQISAEPGQTFLDRMISLVEGANRQKTPNEVALTILLAVLTIIFLPVVRDTAAVRPLRRSDGVGRRPRRPARLPDPDYDRRPAVGYRYRRHGPARAAQRARHERPGGGGGRRHPDAAARQDGHDHPRQPDGIGVHPCRRALRSGTWPTQRSLPRSQTRLPKAARSSFSQRSASISASAASVRITPSSLSRPSLGCPDSTSTGARSAKGAGDAVKRWVTEQGGSIPDDLDPIVERISRAGSTPLVVADGPVILGVIELKDVVKQGITERFDEMRAMGIRTVMITGDNPLTAAAIANEAGVDDFLAEATPENKLALIKQEQEGGRLVAMTGDGTNDAPALAQADVGVAMNTGTTAAKEAGNMVDLDSNPTKLLDIVEIGKQLLITRGALTTFSIANDVAKYFAIIPALFVATYPQLNTLNIMRLHSPQSAVLSAVIFNALVIVALIPLALRGVRFRPVNAQQILRRNIWIYGVGGIIAPFIFIKLIDYHPDRTGGLLMLLLNLRRAVALSVVMIVLCLAYTYVETGIGQVFFKHQANGSLTAYGSTEIGQAWTGPKWFQGRNDSPEPARERCDQLRSALATALPAGADSESLSSRRKGSPRRTAS